MKINEAKQIIYEFFKQKIAGNYPQYFQLKDSACQKIFWDRVKQIKPDKPFIILEDTSVSRVYNRFERYRLNGREYTRKEHQLLVKFSVYTLVNQDNFSDADFLSNELVEFVENLFTTSQSTFDYLYNFDITVNEKMCGAIKDSSIFQQTNQEFIKEIDIVFEFDDVQEVEPEYGKTLEIDIKNYDNTKHMEEII